ncbi:ribonuclease R [Moraxella sp. ZY210820]|uniref:ribonuclease R n=1 Tax=Moraxella sp. ZY210820 TaxID=2904123 RepID=UPI0027319117|nr:ribonuclease R [Moraxella sp. ZY210820]WLF84159.1 ribonuclease R [Moraxella sp. ZY210820]
MTKNWNDPNAQDEAQRYENPIPSRVLIAESIEKLQTAQSHAELVQYFDLQEQKQIDGLLHRLVAMVRDGQLVKEDYKFQVIKYQPEFEATVYIQTKGNGTAKLDIGDEVLLPERELRLVFHGDRVKVRKSRTDNKGTWGFITEVLQHRVKEVLGTVEHHTEGFYIQPRYLNQHQPIPLEKELIEHAKVKVGDILRVAIDDYPTREHFATGHIIQTMENQADTQLIIPQTILEYGLNYEFDPKAIAEAEKFKEPKPAQFKDRVDLTTLPLVTIDGEDARDFDDAVYAEKRAGGGFRVVVAIADVSHYVKPKSALDKEATERGTSVYFPHFVLPMLPEALSNGLCSLNPHVNRLCMVCDLTLSRVGRVTGYQFYPAIMHSHARLTYNQMADYYAGNNDAVPEQADVRKSLNTLLQLYQVLKNVRQQRHALEFETVETYMTFDELGGIQDILPRTRNDAHKLIEECMLLANVAAADFALKNDIPILYRVHEPPEFSRVEKVRDFVKTLGLKFPEQPTQQDYQAIIDATKERLDAPQISSLLLRSMMQARYSDENLGHYGLAYEHYTHFTSPIRRYPDLLLHRAIKAHLQEKPYPISGQALADAGVHFSATERQADEASRSVTSWLKCHYMQQHLGEEFIGYISAVTEFGLFVSLKDVYVDGMIHISQIGDDYFIFDAKHQVLVGQNTGQILGLGDEVKIKVVMVNLDERKIDFALLQQLSRAGRAIRQKAPNAGKKTANAPKKAKKEKVKDKATKPAIEQDKKLSLSDDGKIKKKKKDKVKDKAKKKVKKKKANAKTKIEE